MNPKPPRITPSPWSNQAAAPQTPQHHYAPPPFGPSSVTQATQRISNQSSNNFNTGFTQPTAFPAQPALTPQAQTLTTPATQAPALQVATPQSTALPANSVPVTPTQEPSGHVLHGRPVIELDPAALKHLVPNALILYTSKYLKRANCYLFRGRAVGVRMRLATAIFDKSIKMLELATELNKRRNNLTLIYALDGTHEALRVLWFTYYDSGFLGDYKNKGKVYQPQEALRLFRLINEQLDTIGRLIGAAKARAQEAKEQTKPGRNS